MADGRISACPILPIIERFCPDLAEAARKVGPSPHRSRLFLKSNGLWNEAWDDALVTKDLVQQVNAVIKRSANG